MEEEKIILRNTKDIDDALRGFIIRAVYADGDAITMEVESREEIIYRLVLSDKANIGLKGDLIVLIRGLGVSLVKVK